MHNLSKIIGNSFHLNSNGYAQTKIKHKYKSLHVLLGFSWHDHIDRNKLNNLESNSRKATGPQNSINRPLQRNKKLSQFKGVRVTRTFRWEARIKGIQVGTFDSEIEAAQAYNQKAKELYGDFAYLNPV